MSGEELTAALVEALSSEDSHHQLGAEWNRKCELEEDAEAAKRLAQQYSKLAASRLMQAELIKNSFLAAMKSQGIESVKAGPVTLNVTRGGKKAVVIFGEVPDEFMRIKKEPDKVAIGKALEEGEMLDFAHHDDTPEYIREY